jgi:hypothetical protein
MAVIKHHKHVAALPATLEANSVYYVRTGAGFDIYVTNDSGLVVAYPLNTQGDTWLAKALGEPFVIWTHWPGVEIPPTDNPNYRYIKLTASDSYNDGVLTSESVSGSAPLVQATAVIDYPASPFDGETVRLINTEGRVIRAGNSGTVEADAIQNIVGEFSRDGTTGITNFPSSLTGPFTAGTPKTLINASIAGATYAVKFDASLVVRTANETRMKNIGAEYFVRIR